MTIPTQIKTLREEKMLQVLLLLLPLLLSCQYKYSTASSISKVEPFITFYQNTLDPSRKPVWPVRRGNRKQAGKLEDFNSNTDENQDVYSCDNRLFSKPTLVYS